FKGFLGRVTVALCRRGCTGEIVADAMIIRQFPMLQPPLGRGQRVQTMRLRHGWNCAFAALAQYVSELGIGSNRAQIASAIAELDRGCKNAARNTNMRISSHAGGGSFSSKARNCRCRRC